MSEVRNTTRVNRALNLLVRLTFITSLGLVLGLLWPSPLGSVGVGCVKTLKPGAMDGFSSFTGVESVSVGWPIGWLVATRHFDCGRLSSGLRVQSIDWLFLALNEGIILVGITLISWLYARLRRAHWHNEQRKRNTGGKLDACQHDLTENVSYAQGTE